MPRLHCVAAALGCLAFLGTQVSAQNLKDGQCVQNYDANTDYFPEKLNSREDDAQYFEIDYHNNYKVITDHRNEQQYYLVQCGTPAPAGVSNLTVHNVPVTSVAALETTVVPYLELLGVAQTIDLVADASFITSSCFEKYSQESRNVTDMSASNTTLANQQSDAVEVLFGSSYYTTDPTISTAQSYEPDVLGRVAWLGYYAAFYNLEGLANEIIASITSNYERLQQASSHYKDDEKPLVAWTMFDAPDRYNNNTGSWNVSVASYKKQIVEAAGGRILQPQTLQYFNNDDFLKAITDVDVIIDETYIASNLTDVLDGYGIKIDDESYKFVKNKHVYRTDGVLTPSGGVDWFSGAIVMGDALLSDVINVVNPSAPSSDYHRIWLRNVALDEGIYYTTAANCTWDESKPRPKLGSTYEGGDFTMSGASGLKLAGWTVAVLLSSVVALSF